MNEKDDMYLGQVAWYTFDDDSKILIIYDSLENGVPFIPNETCTVEAVDYRDFNSNNDNNSFHYVILLDVLGNYMDAADFMQKVFHVLSSQGRVLLILNNKYGVRYFCGTLDEYSGLPFGSLNHYAVSRSGRSYDKHTLSDLLYKSGFQYMKYYYPMPDYQVLQAVYTDNILPKEDIHERLVFCFEHEDSLIMDERELYADIIKNEVLPFFSNSFIVECSHEKVPLCDVDYAVVSLDRCRENAFVTAIHSNKLVTKNALFPEGLTAVKNLEKNMNELSDRGLPILQANYEGRSVKMNYICSVTLANHIRELCKRKDQKAIVEVFHTLYQYILASSDVTASKNNALLERYGDLNWGVILKRAYLELIPMNCFYVDGDFLFYDQEFTLEYYPALFILFRAFRYTYNCIPEISSVIEKKKLQELYGITDIMWNVFEKEEQNLQKQIKQREKHKYFYEHTKLERKKKEERAIRVDQLGYKRRYENVLKDYEKKQFALFCTGKYAEIYMKRYGAIYKPCMIVDNDKAKWGTRKWNMQIIEPKELLTIPKAYRKVIVCAGNQIYAKVMRQLERMGIHEYCLFDPNRHYEDEDLY